MAKIFILQNRSNQNYDSVPGEKVFVFGHINGSPDFVEIYNKLLTVLDSACEEDGIVFNGPAYIQAIAGYIWLSSERKTFNIYTYDVKTQKYNKHEQLPFVLTPE